MTPMEALGMLGYALDTPGALTRGVLSGRPGERASGRDMLESWGLLDQNQEGLDAGDVAGFAADMVVDPLNLIGLGAVTKAAKGAKTAKAFNTKAAKLLETGGMPEDVAKLTKAVDEAGNPLRLYHGTPHTYGKPDPMMWDRNALYGPGQYMTANPEVASEYAQKGGYTVAKPRPEFEAAVAANDPRITAAAEKYYGTATDDPFAFGSLERDQFMALPPKQRANELLMAAQLDPVVTGVKLEGLVDLVPPAPQVRMSYLDARTPLPLDDPAYSGLTNKIEGSPHLAPERLKRWGYDSMKHTGGQITGNSPHDVWIATDPAQVYSPWIAPNPIQVPSIAKPAAAVAAYNAVKQLRPPKHPRTLTDYQRLTSLAARSTR